MPANVQIKSTREASTLKNCIRLNQVKIVSWSTMDAFERAQIDVWEQGGDTLLILIENTVPVTQTDSFGKLQTSTNATLIGEAWRCPN